MSLVLTSTIVVLTYVSAPSATVSIPNYFSQASLRTMLLRESLLDAVPDCLVDVANTPACECPNFPRSSAGTAAPIYCWLDAIAANFWPDAGAVPSSRSVALPIGGVVFRSYRHATVPCAAMGALIPPDVAADLARDCIDEASLIDPVSAVPGPGNALWLTNGAISAAGGPAAAAVVGGFAYSPRTALVRYQPASALDLVLPVAAGRATVLAELRARAVGGWVVPERAASVQVHAAVYNPSERSIAVLAAGVDRVAGGLWKVHVAPEVFTLPRLATASECTLFACDAVLLIFCTVTVALEVLRIARVVYFAARRGHPISVASLGLSAFILLEAGVLLSASAARFAVWYYSISATLPTAAWTTAEVLNFVAVVHRAAVVARRQLALGVLLLWLRVLYFMNYMERFEDISVTLRSAFADVVALLIISVVNLVTFGVLISQIFGPYVFLYSSLDLSVLTLMRVLFSADIQSFDEAYAARPVEAVLLFPLYFIVSWMILFNLFLGIITGTFSDLQSARGAREPWDTWVLNLLAPVAQGAATSLQRIASRILPSVFPPVPAVDVPRKPSVAELTAVRVALLTAEARTHFAGKFDAVSLDTLCAFLADVWPRLTVQTPPWPREVVARLLDSARNHRSASQRIADSRLEDNRRQMIHLDVTAATAQIRSADDLLRTHAQRQTHEARELCERLDTLSGESAHLPAILAELQVVPSVTRQVSALDAASRRDFEALRVEFASMPTLLRQTVLGLIPRLREVTASQESLAADVTAHFSSVTGRLAALSDVVCRTLVPLVEDTEGGLVRLGVLQRGAAANAAAAAGNVVAAAAAAGAQLDVLDAVTAAAAAAPAMTYTPLPGDPPAGSWPG